MFKRNWKLFVVLILGIIGVILDFICHKPSIGPWTIGSFHTAAWPIAGVLIDIFGIYEAITMAIEMIDDIKGGRWGVDVLAIIAIISTMAIGDYWAAWMILVMFTGGESLEDYATSQADKELRSLLNNNPRKANKLVDGKLVEVNVDDLKIGDHIVVKPGEQVPVDGKIVDGASNFDQSSLTGESVPVNK